MINKNIVKFALLAFFSLLISACDKKSDSKYADIPSDVLTAIETNVRKNFSDENVVSTWIDRQAKAYKNFVNIVPTIPVKEYSKIVKYAKDVAGDDYITLVDEIDTMMSLAESYNGKLSRLSSEDADFVKSLFNDSSAIEFKVSVNKALEWIAVLDDMNHLKNKFPKESFEALKKKYISQYRNSVTEIMSNFYAQARAIDNVKVFYISKISSKAMDNVKAQIAQEYPHDFVAQFEALKKYDYSSIKEDVVLSTGSKKVINLRNQAERIFRECVFTKRGEGEHIDVAILVKLNGKTVVLCDKNFIPQKWPVVFGNSSGSVSCSKGFVCEEFPLIVLVPDVEPTMFEPIEIISPGESKNLYSKELYMIAPNRGSFTGKSVSVFSEDLHFLNMTEDSTPKTTRSVNIKQLKNKLSDNFFVSIIDKYEVGEHAIVFDPESRKMVSVALRYYNYGDIRGGKVSNIFGHENNSAIPDFVSFVRNFDGNVQRMWAPPGSSVRFVRMTAMKNWTPLNIDKFWQQKNAIRKYTDANNEYIKFIQSGCRYSSDVNFDSVRISKIAKRYKNELDGADLSSDSHNARYKNFIVDIINSMRFDMNRLGNSSFTPKSVYSIYRGEVAYLMALRKAMHQYMQESLKEGKFTLRP